MRPGICHRFHFISEELRESDLSQVGSLNWLCYPLRQVDTGFVQVNCRGGGWISELDDLGHQISYGMKKV